MIPSRTPISSVENVEFAGSRIYPDSVRKAGAGIRPSRPPVGLQCGPAGEWPLASRARGRVWAWFRALSVTAARKLATELTGAVSD